MSENLKATYRDLLFVANIKNRKTQKVMLNYISKQPKYVLALKEITHNIIKGNIHVDDNIKKKLQRHKRNIYDISTSNVKKHIVQSGGWLQWILPLIPIILDLVLD